jgi:acyl carrier protein
MESALAIKIRQMVSELTGIEPEQLTTGADFEADLNLNRLELSELITSLERNLNIEIDQGEIAKVKTFGRLVSIIGEKMEE